MSNVRPRNRARARMPKAHSSRLLRSRRRSCGASCWFDVPAARSDGRALTADRRRADETVGWQDRLVRAADPSYDVTLLIANPSSGQARGVLGAYLEEVASRYHGRPLTSAEQQLARADIPSDDLLQPHGVLLIACLPTRALGCIGMRFVGDGIGELTSLFVVPDARRRGVGTLLLDQIEGIARDRGLRMLRLDTRHDLIEARL